MTILVHTKFPSNGFESVVERRFHFKPSSFAYRRCRRRRRHGRGRCRCTPCNVC